VRQPQSHDGLLCSSSADGGNKDGGRLGTFIRKGGSVYGVSLTTSLSLSSMSVSSFVSDVCLFFHLFNHSSKLGSFVLLFCSFPALFHAT